MPIPLHPEWDALQAAEARLVEYYLDYATEQRRSFLALEEEWDNLNAGIETADRLGLQEQVIAFGDVLTEAWFARGRFTVARHNYPLVMRAALALEEQDPYIAASLNWGKACIDQGDYAEAEEHLQHGLQTSREVNDEYGIANALFLLGRVAVERSEYDAAQKYLTESQTIRERIGDRAGVAETLYMQARIKYRSFNYLDTEKFALQALEIQESQRISQSYIVTLRLLAISASDKGDNNLAKEYIQRALKTSIETQDASEQAAAFYNASIIFRREQNLNSSLEYAERSLSFLNRMGDRKAKANVLNQISRIYADLNETASAIRYGQESLQLYKELKDRQGITIISLHLGDILETSGQRERACQLWSEALPFAASVKHPLATALEEKLEQNCSESNFQNPIALPP